MHDVTLTKSSDKLLCIVYKEFLSRTKSGIPKANAVYFDTLTIDKLFPAKDIEFELGELLHNDFIEKNIIDEFSITSKGIAYMENRLGRTIDKVVDYISKIKP